MTKTKKSKKQSQYTGPTAQLICALVLFVVAVIVSRGPQMVGWEGALFSAVNNLPDFLQLPFLLITQLGSIYMLGCIAVVYFANNHYHKLLRLLLTGLLAYLATGFAKDIWGRERPYELMGDVTNLELIVRGPGFPSGHVALAVALALTVGHYLPKKYRWLVVAWIVGVGLSRMYLGVHAPIDIIGGFAVGWASYALFRHVRLHDINYHRSPSVKAKS